MAEGERGNPIVERDERLSPAKRVRLAQAAADMAAFVRARAELEQAAGDDEPSQEDQQGRTADSARQARQAQAKADAVAFARARNEWARVGRGGDEPSADSTMMPSPGEAASPDDFVTVPASLGRVTLPREV